MNSKNLPSMDHLEFDALEQLLDELRTRDDEVPQWEFCEGAIAALMCTRRAVTVEEALALMVGLGEGDGELAFGDAQKKAQFEDLWTRRCAEVSAALLAKVESLDDEAAYHPEVMDVRGAVAMLPETERVEMQAQALPAFGQVWALGFMFVVENLEEDWVAPRDGEVAQWIDEALDAIVALTEDDADPPAFNMHAENGPPSVSGARANAFGSAIWAVYDLHQIWHSLGPRVEPATKNEQPGRNDPCHCGSGKKFKKCHGT